MTVVEEYCEHEPPIMLIVDDDVDFLSDLAGLHGDCEIRGTADVDEAVDLVRSEVVHGLVADLRMEPSCGIDLLERVHSVSPQLPLALLTGFEPEVNEVARLKLLNAPWFSKATEILDALELVANAAARHQEWMQRPQRESEERVEILEAMHKAWLEDLMEQLRQIPHAEEQVAVIDGESTRVADLIDDIEHLRPRGVRYIRLWLRGRRAVRNAKRGARHD